MKHRIDPKVDCVFKALLGAEANRALLIHFLNAILSGEFAAPICEAQIPNPYNEKELPDDKLSIVDVALAENFQRRRPVGRSKPAPLDEHKRNEASHEHLEAIFRERARLPRLPG